MFLNLNLRTTLPLITYLGQVLANGLVWESLPQGYDISRPDEILETVRNKHRNDIKFPFTHIYIFGDSSCDTGNYIRRHNSDLPTVKYYWKNRFSNGPMWPDYLQAINNVRVKNFCHGGAPVSSVNHVIEPGVPDFFDQIRLYKKDRYDPQPKRPLGILGFIGNDLLTNEVQASKVGVDYYRALVKLIEVGEIKDILATSTPSLPFRNRGVDIAFEKAVERIAEEYPEVNIATLTALELQTLMVMVPPPNSDVTHWKGFSTCFNQTSFTICDDPQHRFLHDFYHFNTVAYYNIACRMTRFITKLWVK